MTLVAAYRSAGVPILLGDFLISSGDSRARARKKISRPRSNLAIGWAGSFLQANHVLGQLTQALDDKPAKDSFERVLAAVQVESNPSLHLKLAGWICDEREVFGFYWDSATQQVVWGEEWFLGSGGRPFEYGFAGYRRSRDPRLGFQERNVLEDHVALLATLNCTDRITKEGHEQGVGGGYEALYWANCDGEFRYLESVLYFVLGCRMDAQGSCREQPELVGDSLMGYRAAIAGDNSILDISEGEAHDRWVMSPADHAIPSEDLLDWLRAEQGQVMDLGADFYGGLMVFSAPTLCPPAPLVGCPWDEHGIFKGSRGRIECEIPPQAIETAYRERLALYEENPFPLLQMPSLNPR